MSTAEIVAIAAAVVVVLVIVIVLATRGRRRKRREASPPGQGEGSMFDRPPSDTLARLGKPEDRGEQPAPAAEDGGEHRPAAPEGAGAPLEAEPEPRPQPLTSTEAGPAVPGEEGPAQTVAAEEAQGEAEKAQGEGAQVEAEEAQREEAEARPEEAGEPERESEPATPLEPQEDQGRLVPLSSIIVTTSNKIVDLDDPEIRRMLTDLVTFEIDQAEQFREQGQTIDAVLQLTEAEKICRALGKEDTAGQIRAMMRELQA